MRVVSCRSSSRLGPSSASIWRSCWWRRWLLPSGPPASTCRLSASPRSTSGTRCVCVRLRVGCKKKKTVRRQQNSENPLDWMSAACLPGSAGWLLQVLNQMTLCPWSERDSCCRVDRLPRWWAWRRTRNRIPDKSCWTCTWGNASQSLSQMIKKRA